jgi:Flp pilus assembly protein TadG
MGLNFSKTQTATFRREAKRRRQAGASMVETAFVLPLLLLLVFMTVEFGIAFGRYQVITNAAREGAREAILYRPGACAAGSVEDAAELVVNDYAELVGIDTTDLTVNIFGICDQATTVEIDLPYQFSVLKAFGIGTAGVQLHASAVMRNENE